MLTIRQAVQKDAPRLLEIYAYYIRNTAVTFEYTVPSVEEFRERIRHTLEHYPYLVALQNGRIIGYAYAGPFSERTAYDWSSELSIYLAPDARQNGAGKNLYESLETILRDMGIVNLYARIACPQGPDPYLSEDSLHFHEHMGFAQEGLFRNCAYKFGRWYALSCMVKSIAPHLPQQPPVTPYPQLLPKDTIQ